MRATRTHLRTSVLGSRPPFGGIDTPTAGGTASVAAGQDLPIAGWVLDTAHVDTVHVEVDGVAASDIAVSAGRPDVCEVFPAYDGCPNVGFSGSLSTAGWNACPHLVRVTAKDADNNTTVLGESVVTVVP